MKTESWIEITGAQHHNLKNVSLRIPREKLTVVTGPSGSGKSTLAFDTLFAEGQRRFVESLPAYTRQFLPRYEKPEVESILGLTPTLALEQKNQVKNSRSTVGTQTEIYDYLRLLFAKCGVMISPETGEVVKPDLIMAVTDELISSFQDQLLYVVFPVDFSVKSKIADRKRLVANLLECGFSQAFLANFFSAPEKGLVAEPVEIETELGGRSSPELLGKAGKPHMLFVVVDRMSIDAANRGRLEDALAGGYREGFGRCRAIVLDPEKNVLHRKAYAEYPSTGGGEHRYPELTPQLFSFNSPVGACEGCHGFGNILQLDQELVIPNPNLSISQGAIDPFTKPSAKEWLRSLLSYCKSAKVLIHSPWNSLSADARKRVWFGDEKHDWQGILGIFKELESDRYKMQVRVFLSRYRSPHECPDCKGSRLRKEARSVFVHKKTISDICSMPLNELAKWFQTVRWNKTEKETAKDILPQVESRLDFLLRVGLEYLTLSRLAKTLSGGEAQRIALANQLGSRLTQTTYVLDEPSIGLHPRDTERLISILKDLRDLKNTVVVVEHDPEVMRAADWMVDLGPHAGEKGGELLFSGPANEFLGTQISQSTTALFLQGKDAVPVPKRRRLDRFQDKGSRVHWLEVEGCSEHNLQKVNFKIPLHMLTCVTGVSGSGKSTAIRKTLYPALAKILMQATEPVGRFETIRGFESIQSVVSIDQDPIGRSPRSNPITFMKSFDEVRQLLASTPEAKRRHYHAGHFSFNVPGGRCEHCEGEGYTRVEMVFMEDLFVKCDYCEGKRFKPEILEIRHQHKNIHEILQLSVSEARKFFLGATRLQSTLSVLEGVGLGYLKLGQPATTLSGGESQRL
jgi:excinuclease ABC subunit A